MIATPTNWPSRSSPRRHEQQLQINTSLCVWKWHKILSEGLTHHSVSQYPLPKQVVLLFTSQDTSQWLKTLLLICLQSGMGCFAVGMWCLPWTLECFLISLSQRIRYWIKGLTAILLQIYVHSPQQFKSWPLAGRVIQFLHNIWIFRFHPKAS